MTNESDAPKADLGTMIGTNIGNLFALSIFQTKAIMALASAIAKDPAVAPETKAKAEEAMRGVDDMISLLERSMQGDGIDPIDVKGFVDGQ